ncbi:ABC transporter substrate-binding protein [Limnospira platensis CENA597]|uniref:ABC transporter substrate-binding protein n=1 Tax=Limnospira platensis TaxID=118562 RepID=UPI003D6DBB1E
MGSKTWKRFVGWALLGLLLTWGVSCASPTTDQSDRRQVEFWTMQLQPQFNDYFNQLIATFENDHPEVKIRWVDVPWSAMESKILAAVSAQTAPDLVNLNPDFASMLAGRDAWLNLDEHLSEEVRSLYLPNIWEANMIQTCDGDNCQNRTFGIPWYLTTQIVIYNQNLLNQAGIENPPTTYQELATVAQTIRQRTGKYALFVSFVPTDSAQVLQSLVQMGVQLVDNNRKAAFNTPEGRAAFQYWVDLYQQDLLPREVLTQGHRRAIELYQAGEIALLTTGPQFFRAIAENAPDIAKVSAPSSAITGENGKISVAVMNLVIPQNTRHPEDAINFALFVTNSANQLNFAKASNVIPSSIQALENPFFQNIPADATPQDKARKISAQQMPNAQVLIPPLEDIKELQTIIYNNLQAAMLNQKTVDQAILDAETAWNRRLN